MWASRHWHSRSCTASTRRCWRPRHAATAGSPGALAEELNRRLYENLRQTAVNAFGSVRQRVALHVLDLASAQQDPGGQLVARVSQQELAEAVGSVREVVARVLRDLRSSGLVATVTEGVHIVDPAGLHDQTWDPIPG